MGEAQLILPIFDEEEAKEAITSTPFMIDPPPPPLPPPRVSRYVWWLRVTIYTIFSLSGQSSFILLLQLYFQKGGNSKWMSTLIQTAGFPVLVPFIFFFPRQKQYAPQNNNNNNNNNSSSLCIVALTYIFIGIILAANCTCFSLGVAILPASTFSIICASQLAFTAFFSYFVNTQKITPLIINSLVLLTISSTLLVFQQDGQQGSSKISKSKYSIGFMCAVGVAATGGLYFAAIQFAFRKILKSTTFRVILDMMIYECLLCTVLLGIGVFASGEWKTLKGEMEGYELGRRSYVMTLVGIAVSNQVNFMGIIGLVFEVSSLFSNVISALGVPIVPMLAVVIFHDKMSGVKVIAMLLAIWGIASYIYQEYLDDDSNSKAEIKHVNQAGREGRAGQARPGRVDDDLIQSNPIQSIPFNDYACINNIC